MARAPFLPVLALVALVGAQMAQAQATNPANPTCPPNPNWFTEGLMTFRVMERAGDRPVLLAEGQIDRDLVPRLRAALEAFQGDEIWLRSLGRDARAGNEAARLIRQNGVMTRIPNGWACNGACAFMFMGGIVRTVEPNGLFIVQTTRFSTRAPSDEIAQATAQMASEDSDFPIRMGVSRTLASEILYQPAAPATRRCLTQAELARYNVTNRPIR